MDAPRASVLTDRELSERLKEAGLRSTHPRRLVYAYLRDRGGHRSADQITAALKNEISRMSAYNALTDLLRAGVIQSADAGPGRALYEANTVWHHHFVCRKCGRIFDTPCVKGRKPCLDLSAAVGVADEAQIIFRGVCNKCATS